VNFDVGDVLTRAWQVTWKHKVLWVFNMFPVLLSFLFIPIVFILMVFIGPNALINQDFIDSPTYVSAFIAFNLFLTALSMLLYASGAASSLLGVLRIENGSDKLPFRDLFQDGLDYFWRVLGVSLTIGAAISIVFLLPVLALVQGFSLTFMKSAFMIIYLRLTRSTVLQPTSL
jgi:hypothetical protein